MTPRRPDPTVLRINPAISVILNGTLGGHSLDPEDYVRAGFPLVGEGGPRASGLSLGESEAGPVTRTLTVKNESSQTVTYLLSEQSALARAIGCEYEGNGGVKCSQYSATSVAGVYAAGNITRDVQLAIVAAAEGTKAAFGINRALTREDFARKAKAR